MSVTGSNPATSYSRVELNGCSNAVNRRWYKHSLIPFAISWVYPII